MAALTAAKEGAGVLVVESGELVGGATGISAGAAWIPNHGFSTKQLEGRGTTWTRLGATSMAKDATRRSTTP